jgi:hypothetical protein
VQVPVPTGRSRTLRYEISCSTWQHGRRSSSVVLQSLDARSSVQTAVTITPTGPLPGVSFTACASQLLVPLGCDAWIALPGLATAPPPSSAVPGGHVDVAWSLVEYWSPTLFAIPDGAS